MIYECGECIRAEGLLSKSIDDLQTNTFDEKSLRFVEFISLEAKAQMFHQLVRTIVFR